MRFLLPLLSVLLAGCQPPPPPERPVILDPLLRSLSHKGFRLSLKPPPERRTTWVSECRAPGEQASSRCSVDHVAVWNVVADRGRGGPGERDLQIQVLNLPNEAESMAAESVVASHVAFRTATDASVGPAHTQQVRTGPNIVLYEALTAEVLQEAVALDLSKP